MNLKISHKGVFFAYLGETISLIACLHVCLYFLPLFTRKTGSAERERRENLVGEERVYLFRDGGGEQSFFFFSETAVGGDREVRRYLFHSYLAEIEFE